MQAWLNFIVSWVPFLMLIVVWVYFVKKMRGSRHGELVDRNFIHMDRVEALLERIAIAAEQRQSM